MGKLVNGMYLDFIDLSKPNAFLEVEKIKMDNQGTYRLPLYPFIYIETQNGKGPKSRYIPFTALPIYLHRNTKR